MRGGQARRGRRRAWRAVAGAAAALVVVPVLVAAAPAVAGSHRAWSPFRLPAPRSVPGHPVPAGAGAAQRARLARWLRAHQPGARPARRLLLPAVWPPTGTATVAVGTGRAGRSVGGPVAAGRLPVAITAVGGPRGAPAAAGKVRVGVAGHAAAVRAGVRGVLVTVGAAGGLAAGERLRVRVGYRGFAGEYGGAWAQRLRLVELPACALTTPARAACRYWRMLPGGNDPAAQAVSAVVTLPAAPGGAGRPGPVVLAVTSGPSGPQGDYTATPLRPSGTWAVQQGDFTYSYPVTVPPSLGGAAPDVTLSYDAQSVDSETAGSNTQGGWIGEGWDYSPGFIERAYQPCSQDGITGSGDLCWDGDNAVLSLNGTTMPLVEDSHGIWHPQNDDGSQAQLLTGASNGLWKGQYWVLTTTDGTEYYFGLNHLPGDSSSADTQSAWGVPVYCPETGDPCHSAGEATMGWQWNLDYMVDPAGNLTVYDYSAETNYYEMGGGQNGGNGTLTQYDRGGTLASISYGWLLPDAVNGASPAAQVLFGTAQRCTSTDTATCNSNENSTYWPDVPWDQNCTASQTGCTNYAPTFWSTQRLATITTQVLAGTSYQPVDSYALAQCIPKLMGGCYPADAGNAVMFLDSITRTGEDGTDVSLQPVSFYPPAEMDNLVPGQTSQGEAQVYRPRVETVTTETGAQIDVQYRGQQCTDASGNFPTPDSNKEPCYPVYWIPPAGTSAVYDWYYKSLVAQVSVNDVTGADTAGQGGASSLVTSYNYLGGAAWHQNTAPIVAKGSRTWDQYRGFAQVETMTGESTDPVTDSITTYMRGMNGDATASGGTKTVTVSDSLGDSYPDDNWLAGQLLETDTNTAPGGTTDAKTVNGPWAYDANPNEPGTAPDLTSHMLEQAQARTLTLTAAGAWATVATNTYYNSDAQVTAVDQNPDGSAETCTSTSYASPPSANLMMESYPDQVTVVTGSAAGGACPAATSANIVSDARTYYDHPGTDLASLGTLGTLASPGGLVTGTAAAVTWPAGGSETWQPRSAAEQDEYGRVTSATDARSNTTTTAYTPATGALPTQTVVTNPLAWATTTTLDPGRQLPLTITDPNKETTTDTYDALGRLTSVTLPLDQGQQPTYKYAYAVDGTDPPAVTTQTLLEDGHYSSDIRIYDGMLQLRQEQQTPANGATGALITDTYHDSHGWVVKTSAPYYENNTTSPSTTPYSALDSNVPAQTVTAYDGLGRVTASKFYSLGQFQWQTTTAYPGMDETDVTPPAGGTATSTFTDALGQTTKLYHYLTPTPDGQASDADATSYTYTPAGQLHTVTDNADNTWAYGYNLLGQKTSASDPDTGTTTYTYDPDGDLATSTDANNTELLYKYDALDRKTAEYAGSIAPANELASWRYDTLDKGYLTSSTAYTGGASGDPYIEAITGYNAAYQPAGTKTTIPASQGALAGQYTTTLNYWPLTGLPQNTVYNGDGGLPAETVSYSYDLEGLLSSIGGQAFYLNTDTYTPQGQIQYTDSGGAGKGFTQTYTYDPATNWLLTATTSLQGLLSAADTVNYTYNQAGDITSQSGTQNSGATQLQCFTYDNLQRLTTAWTDTGGTTTAPAPSVGGIGGCTNTKPAAATIGGAAPYWQSYKYDLLGDRTSQTTHDLSGNTANNITQTLTYPGGGTAPAAQPDIPTTITTAGPGGTTTTSVTANNDGQTTAQTSTTSGTSPPPGPPTASAITYTPQGQAASVNPPGPGTATYLYDANGNLLLQHDPGSTTLYLDGGTEELTLAGETVTGLRFYPLPGEATVVRSSVPAADNSELHYEVTSQQPTATSTIDATSLAETRRYYDPYGNPAGATPAWWPDNLGFAGKPADPATGLGLLGARQYDSVAGAFLSADPLFDPTSPLTMGGYAYAADNPATNTDPTGLYLTGSGSGCGYTTSCKGSGGSGGGSGGGGTGGGGYDPGSCSRYGSGCGGAVPAIQRQLAGLTTGNFLSFLAGVGNGLAGLGDTGICAQNPLICVQYLASGDTLSAAYTNWIASQGIPTGPHSGYAGGAISLGIILAAAGGLAGGSLAGADAATAPEDGVFAGLNAVRADTGASVAARLQLGDESFMGTSLARGNAPIKGTFSFFVQHAEGDAFSQAISTGNSYAGQSGTLSVTQAPCGFCVSSISATARSLGLARLVIETPDGVFGTYTPDTGLVRGP